MEKRYTVKANGTNAEGKKVWAVYDKETETFLTQFEGGRFQLQDIAKGLNEGTIALETETEAADHDTSKIVGYMRISTDKDSQKFDRQEQALLDAGCEVIYSDRISGSKRDRPELNKMLEELQEGDTVIILAIDRLSRSTRDLLEIVELIKSKGAFLKSINDSWLDTTSANPMNDFLLTVMGALAQMERALITQRVQEGVEVAKRKGIKLGRPKANQNKVDYALELYHKGEHNIKQILDITGISKATLYRKLRESEGTPYEHTV